MKLKRYDTIANCQYGSVEEAIDGEFVEYDAVIKYIHIFVKENMQLRYELMEMKDENAT